MSRALRIYLNRARSEVLLELFADEAGRVTSGYVASDLRSMVSDWLRRGLRELVRDGERVRPRVTLPSDPAFLTRLADDVRKQTRFHVTLEEAPAAIASTNTYALNIPTSTSSTATATALVGWSPDHAAEPPPPKRRLEESRRREPPVIRIEKFGSPWAASAQQRMRNG